jgi:hypothetical protein
MIPESGSRLVVIARSRMIRGLGADELAYVNHLEPGGRGLLRLQRNRESERFNKNQNEMIKFLMKNALTATSIFNQGF